MIKDRNVFIEERVLHFKQPAGTSRGVYTERKIWLVTVTDGDAVGVGECAPLPDLSCDAGAGYGDVLRRFCDNMDEMVMQNYTRIKDEVKQIVADELERVKQIPDLARFIKSEE